MAFHLSRRLVVFLAVAAAAIVAYLAWPNEEHRVRARLEDLAASLSVPPSEPDLARLARASRVRGFFTEDVLVSFEEATERALHGRDEIAGVVARPWGPPSGVKVELLNLQVSVESGGRADARLEARAVSLEPGAESATLDARMVALTLRRIDGTWLISSARVMRSDDALRAP